MAKTTSEPVRRQRYDFFLNAFDDMAFTKCPRCDTPTRQKKVSLVVGIKPPAAMVLHSTSRYCANCELLIVRKREVEPAIASVFPTLHPLVENENWLILGTLDRADHPSTQPTLARPEVLERVWLFRKHITVEVRGGLGPSDSK